MAGFAEITGPNTLANAGGVFSGIGFGFTATSAFLSGSVNLTNTTTYFDGPTIAQGNVGTWFVTGTVTVLDNNGSATFKVKLWDGITVIASAAANVVGATGITSVTVSGFIQSPANNLRISVLDATSTGGVIEFNITGLSMDSNITAVRIA
jgi:hypothetical protein